MTIKIGILSLQGAVTEHMGIIEKCGVKSVEVKHAGQLKNLEGLIIPGGESTTIGKLMRTYGFIEEIREFSRLQKPIFGTCAGLILMAKKITEEQGCYLDIFDITVSRNAFGRQKESFEADLQIDILDTSFRAIFIRAPLVQSCGNSVKILATYNHDIVAVRQGHFLGTSFHPELTNDKRIHEYFIQMAHKSLCV